MNSHFAVIRTVIISLTLLISLISCGGGGGDSTTDTTDASLLNGVWSGILHSDSTASDYEVVGLIYEGEVRLISTQANSVYLGSATVNNSTFSANSTAYEINGGVIGTLTISGTYIPGSSASGTYTSTTNDTGTLSLSYDTVYDRVSSLSLTQGIWMQADASSTTTITAEADGGFVGGNTYGCAYIGNILIINESKNIYDTTLTISNCGAYDGNYEGLAVLSDTADLNDTLSFILNQGNYIIFTEFMRSSLI